VPGGVKRRGRSVARRRVTRIERHAREKSPVWADGDTATFFHRGEALDKAVEDLLNDMEAGQEERNDGVGPTRVPKTIPR
jgi:hypothetical protein